MSKKHKKTSAGAMLDLWRPPSGAGDAIGCLASTFTFNASLFDEQCLARFLEVESEPNREDLAFLLERESRLGGAYAGVLVDHTQAGVEHSLRWDVLPVRIPSGKQHAKISLLAWTNHVRIIVASANLTEPGYRTNQEVALALDLSPDKAVIQHLDETCDFLRTLLAFVPGAETDLPEIKRAMGFLEQVERQAESWKHVSQPKATRQYLAFTLPGLNENPLDNATPITPRSSLDEGIERCRYHGPSPSKIWVASPFYDINDTTDAATASLCKKMARGGARDLCFCVPAVGETDDDALRLAAPESLRLTPKTYNTEVEFEILTRKDHDQNPRPWHAKMISLQSNKYSALMAGSSNFTRAGLGIGRARNAEANILTIAERLPHAREPKQLEQLWPDMLPIADPSTAEWQGPSPDVEEEQGADDAPMPAGFLNASFRAGDDATLILKFSKEQLPEEWAVWSCDNAPALVVDREQWIKKGKPANLELDWAPVLPPVKLLVRWPEGERFWPINVEDPRRLPAPTQLEHMSADEMLSILAAADPSIAFRRWSRERQAEDSFENDLDTAMPDDLDPLRRHDLGATFLRRIRKRARVLAQLRHNLERAVWSSKALEWRLGGFIGIKPLADRLVAEMGTKDGNADESLLGLADLVVILHEVDYQPVDGAIPKPDFDQVYSEFLDQLLQGLDGQVKKFSSHLSNEVLVFWNRVVKRCLR